MRQRNIASGTSQGPDKNRKIVRPQCLDWVATINIVKWQLQKLCGPITWSHCCDRIVACPALVSCLGDIGVFGKILNLITDDSRKLFCIWFGWESALFSDSFRPSRELISWLGGAIWNWFMRNKQTENLVTQNYYKKVRPRNSSYVNIVPGCVPLSAPSIPSSWRKNQDSQR